MTGLQSTSITSGWAAASAAEPDDHVLQSADVQQAGCRDSRPAAGRWPAPRNHARRLGGGHRREPDGHVAEQLDRGSSLRAGDERAEQWVDGHPGEQLYAAWPEPARWTRKPSAVMPRRRRRRDMLRAAARTSLLADEAGLHRA